MKTAVVAVTTVMVSASVLAADTTIRIADGTSVSWEAFVADNGPLVVLVYASWAPHADEALREIDTLQSAAASRRLGLVVVAVQETFEEARSALGDVGVEWMHDRHGNLLRRYRVIRVPTLLVVGADGEVRERHEVSAAELRAGASP